ncbi:MAG: hypothetical protein JSS14_14865 [Proteobacteria bacterium]|nr:hypothetical protein [Pseudomonadota bacterium]
MSYAVEYALGEGQTNGNWWGEVLLLTGKRHKLAGGLLTNMTRQTMAQAVILALNAEIDSLDFGKLNTPQGN